MKAKSLIPEINELIVPVIESLGCDLIETEYVNQNGTWVLRLYIDNEKGSIKLGDCEKVSKSVSAILDVEDVVPGKYNLEVSSPGIERPLRREKDFKKYIGSKVKVKTIIKIDGQKNFNGVLKGTSDGVISIDEDGKISELEISNIAKARLCEQNVNINSAGKCSKNN